MNHKSNDLSYKKFTSGVKGYDKASVDAIMEGVIKDYQVFEKYHAESQDYIQKLEKALHNDGETINALKVEGAKLKSKIDGLKNKPADASRENADYIRRIHELEKYLYARGINPKTGKKYTK